MIDCTRLTNVTFVNLLSGNDKFNQILSTSSNWEEVLICMGSLKLKYTEEQIEYLKNNKWLNE
jgi:hypothetical protein